MEDPSRDLQSSELYFLVLVDSHFSLQADPSQVNCQNNTGNWEWLKIIFQYVLPEWLEVFHTMLDNVPEWSQNH